MLIEIRTLATELKQNSSFRVAFALAPFHGSDREVGWSALQADMHAGRRVTYITSSSDFLTIASHFPENVASHNPTLLEFQTVRVVAWPLSLPTKFLPIGYARFLIWVVMLQIFISLSSNRDVKKRIHFLTYTQLATPIFLPKAFEVFHGPAGTIPKIPWRSPCSKALVLKSQLMWLSVMPIISFLKRRRPVRSAVVHPSLVRSLEDTGEIDVLSALHVDYLADQLTHDLTKDKSYDAIAVGRNIPIKNMALIAKAFQKSSELQSLNFLIINSNLPADHRETFAGTTVLGRQERHIVAEYLRSSRLHVMLSLELGGYINLEAAICGTPTLCLDSFGASHLLNPHPAFRMPLENLDSDHVADKIVSLLSDNKQMRQEALDQAEYARIFIEANRQRFDHFLAETI